jgi:hypothetical protein
MKYIDVNPDEIDNIRQSRRGRVSYPILKGFLETGKYLVQLDTTGIQQSRQSLTSSLNTYIRNHGLPIKMFQRSGKIYLMRLDIDKDGNAIKDWQETEIKQHLETLHIDDDTVKKQFESESKKVTK